MTSARLCVIVLNYANWRDTLECLESLTRAALEDLSVVVVDTGSPDDSLERLRGWVETGHDARPRTAAWRGLPERPVQRPAACELVAAAGPSAPRALPRLGRALTLHPAGRRLGFAAGCNAGIRLALCDPRVRYLWLLNNDAIVAPDAPTRLVARAEAIGPPLGALGALVADYRRPDRIQMLGGGHVARFSAEPVFPAHGSPLAAAGGFAAATADLDYISGASLLTTVEAVREVGLLDESMHLYWEDTDWCARMRQAGRRIAVCPEAVIWHKGHASTGGINRYTKYHAFRSAAVYMRRHRRRWLTPLAVRLAKSLTRDLIHLRPLDAAASARGLLAGMRIALAGSPPTAAGEAWRPPRAKR